MLNVVVWALQNGSVMESYASIPGMFTLEFWMTFPFCIYMRRISVSSPLAVWSAVMNRVTTVNLSRVSTVVPIP